MPEIILPDWYETSLIPKKDRTALQNFIYEQEPAGTEQAEKFRADLMRVLKEAATCQN